MRLLTRSALAVPFALGAMSCASATTAGTGEVTTEAGEPVRVPIMVINESLTNADLSVGGTAVERILPSSRTCVLLPARVDNRDLRIGSYTVIRQVWSSEQGWQVTIPESRTSPRITAFPALPCEEG
jgi:hypothetical protein